MFFTKYTPKSWTFRYPHAPNDYSFPLLSPGEHHGNPLIYQVREKLAGDLDSLLPLFDVAFTNCV
jgi:hypothetical protein